MRLSQKLQELRAKAQVTQAEVVKGIHEKGGSISQSYLSFLESGKRTKLTPAAQKEIADFYHVPVEFLQDDELQETLDEQVLRELSLRKKTDLIWSLTSKLLKLPQYQLEGINATADKLIAVQDKPFISFIVEMSENTDRNREFGKIVTTIINNFVRELEESDFGSFLEIVEFIVNSPTFDETKLGQLIALMLAEQEYEHRESDTLRSLQLLIKQGYSFSELKPILHTLIATYSEYHGPFKNPTSKNLA